jgi:predicted MFS family arabinose efflux permease
MSNRSESLWQLTAVRHLFVVTLLGFSSFGLTLAALPTWAGQGGASHRTAGLVTTVMLATTVATQGLVPAMIVRLGSGPALALGLLLLGAPAPLYGLSAHLGVLLPVSVVRGTGFALLTVIGAALTGSVAPPERHGESVGLYGLAIALPNLLGVPAGVALTQSGHFSLVAILAASPVLAIPLAVRSGFGRRVRSFDPPSGPETPESTAKAGRELSSRQVVLLTLAPAIVLLLVTAAGGGLVTFLSIQRPTGALAATGLLVFGAAAALARWRVGALVDRVGPRVLLPASVLATVSGFAGVALCLLGGASYDLLLLGSAFVFGLGYGAAQNITLVIAFARAGAAGAPTASAVWNAAFDTGTALGAVAVGSLADAGLGLPKSFLVAAAVVLLALPVGMKLTRSAERGPL